MNTRFWVAAAASLLVASSASAAPIITYGSLDETQVQAFAIDPAGDVGISAAEAQVDWDTGDSTSATLLDLRVIADDTSIGIVLDGPADLSGGGGIYQLANTAQATLFLGGGATETVNLNGFVLTEEALYASVTFFGGGDQSLQSLAFSLNAGGELQDLRPGAPIPEPASGLLFMAGMLAVGHAVRRNDY